MVVGGGYWEHIPTQVVKNWSNTTKLLAFYERKEREREGEKKSVRIMRKLHDSCI